MRKLSKNHKIVLSVVGLFVLVAAGYFLYKSRQQLATNDQNLLGSSSITNNEVLADQGSVEGVSTVKLPTGSAWLTTIPLGDNKYSTSGAKKGYIYLCNVMQGGQGAKVNGPWIHGTTWNPSEKVEVQGKVKWPNAAYNMKISGTNRIITSNDLPNNHTTGVFPIATTDPAYKYDANHGTITAQNLSFTLPANPTPAKSPGCIYGEVGIMNDGVMLYDAFDALYRDALAHEEQDDHKGHPNDHGYHYHGFGSELKEVGVGQVVGFAFDGYPITGPKLPTGKYLHTADLDECHGLTSEVTVDGKKMTLYHYVLTQDFPYSVSCFKGTSKFKPTPPSGNNNSGSTNQTGPNQIPPAGGPPPGGMPPPPGAF